MSRLRILAAAVGVLWCVVFIRAVWVVQTGDSLRDAAVRQRISTTRIEPEPGRLVDRSGRLLALSRRRKSIFADPSRIEDAGAFARRVGPVLNVDEEQLESDLAENRTRRFRWIRRLVSDDQVSALSRLNLPAGAWGARTEWDRLYPQGTLAAHLVGFRDVDHKPRIGFDRRFHAQMQGVAGQRVTVRDSRGRVLRSLEAITQNAVAGETIPLTIDAAMQAVAGRELDRLVDEFHPDWATAVVIDVQRSTLAAVETRPTFDPNEPGGTPAVHQVNHAFRTAVEPGSTVKPFVIGRAIDSEHVLIGERVECDGPVARFGAREVRDSHAIGRVPLAEVLVESSNIGTSRIAERLGNDELFDTLQRLGFGAGPDTQPSISSHGALQEVAMWSDYSLISHAIGYEFTVTPLQLAMAYNAIARDGQTSTLRLVQSEAATTRPTAVLSAATARWLRTQPLADVVRRGTARRAAADGEVVWGKTGTSQIFDTSAGAYRRDQTVCLFAGGIPANDPKLVIAVVVYNPKTGNGRGGGSVAAPAAGKILRDGLKLLRGQERLATGANSELD